MDSLELPLGAASRKGVEINERDLSGVLTTGAPSAGRLHSAQIS
jgi:hypothetical protein